MIGPRLDEVGRLLSDPSRVVMIDALMDGSRAGAGRERHAVDGKFSLAEIAGRGPRKRGFPRAS
jgi:hypothetical protein